MSLLAIDALNIARRIYEAIPLTDVDRASKTVKSCVASYRRAIEEHRPTHAVVVFDHGGRTWRHDLYAKYKSSRKPTPVDFQNAVSEIKAELSKSGIQCICVPEVEADDAIAALVEKWCQSTKDNAIILSTDKDFLQLLSSQVHVYDHFKSKWLDEVFVIEKFGVTVSQFGDLLALMGDASDDVPGVEKIGQKTAARLLKINGNLERVLSNADKVDGQVGVNLRAGIDSARLSKKLVSFKTDIQLGITWKLIKVK